MEGECLVSCMSSLCVCGRRTVGDVALPFSLSLSFQVSLLVGKLTAVRE